jgi:hypothetical protein
MSCLPLPACISQFSIESIEPISREELGMRSRFEPDCRSNRVFINSCCGDNCSQKWRLTATSESIKSPLLQELLLVFRLQDCGSNCVTIPDGSEFLCGIDTLGIDFSALRWRFARSPTFAIDINLPAQPGEEPGERTWYSAQIVLESF